MINKSHKEIYILIFSFLITSIVAKFYLNKFDNFNSYQNGNHPMIKSSVGNHWSEANVIIEDYKKGKSFIQSGSYSEDEFLPPKLLAIYHLLTNQEMYSDNKINVSNGKLYYLIIKNFLYFFLIFIFFRVYQNLIHNKIIYWLIIYLAFLPDIIQYLPSYWNESWTIIFQILLLIILFKINFGLRYNFLLGILSACLFLTGQEYLLYPIIFLIYYFFLKIFYKIKIFKIFLRFILGYSLILFGSYFVSSFKSKNQNENFYGMKSALYIYVVPNIIIEKKKISYEEARKSMKNEALNWAKKEGINFKKVNDSTLLLNIERDDYLSIKKYNNYIFGYSIKKIFFNFHYGLKYFLKKIPHMLVLNPFFVHNFYEYESVANFLSSEKHQSNIKIRLVYSFIFYLFLLYGFFRSLKIYKPEFIFLLVLLVLYNLFVLGFLGTPRYFTPSLVYMGFFFAAIVKQKKSINLT